MGWSYCGQDDLGRDIGSGVVATCDFPGCEERITRGLGYLCGKMHGCRGDEEGGCGRYFCDKHLHYTSHNCDCPPEQDCPMNETSGDASVQPQAGQG